MFEIVGNREEGDSQESSGFLSDEVTDVEDGSSP